MVEIADSIRGKNIYIVQTGTKYVFTKAYKIMNILKNEYIFVSTPWCMD